MLENATIRTNNFEPIRKVKPMTNQSRFNKKLNEVSLTYKDRDWDLYNKLKHCTCTDPVPNSPYVLPKDHKPGPLKGRPGWSVKQAFKVFN